jgi:hypothetical protein
MATIETVIRSINRDLTPLFEERLRATLATHDRDWLIDQIVRLTLDRHSLEEIDRRSVAEAKARARAERLARVRAMVLDVSGLDAFLDDLGGSTRERLVAAGFLAPDAPVKGTGLITSAHRGAAGSAPPRRGRQDARRFPWLG